MSRVLDKSITTHKSRQYLTRSAAKIHTETAVSCAENAAYCSVWPKVPISLLRSYPGPLVAVLTSHHFQNQSANASVGPPGPSGLAGGGVGGRGRMKAGVGDRFDCFSGLGWRGCKCIDVCVYEIMKNLLGLAAG